MAPLFLKTCVLQFLSCTSFALYFEQISLLDLCLSILELPEHLADLWLESLARGTMHHYSEQILKILELSSLGTRQLITDIGKRRFFEQIPK